MPDRITGATAGNLSEDPILGRAGDVSVDFYNKPYFAISVILIVIVGAQKSLREVFYDKCSKTYLDYGNLLHIGSAQLKM